MVISSLGTTLCGRAGLSQVCRCWLFVTAHISISLSVWFALLWGKDYGSPRSPRVSAPPPPFCWRGSAVLRVLLSLCLSLSFALALALSLFLSLSLSLSLSFFRQGCGQGGCPPLPARRLSLSLSLSPSTQSRAGRNPYPLRARARPLSLSLSLSTRLERLGASRPSPSRARAHPQSVGVSQGFPREIVPRGLGCAEKEDFPRSVCEVICQHTHDYTCHVGFPLPPRRLHFKKQLTGDKGGIAYSLSAVLFQPWTLFDVDNCEKVRHRFLRGGLGVKV